MSLRTARRFATGQPGQPVAMPHDPAHPARDLLAVFVNDHLAVVAGGQALARRAAASAGPAPLADALRDTGELLAAQASALRELLRRQGLREQRAKQWLAIAGERAGRLKLNGRVVRPSPLSRLMELEGVLLALHACRVAWRALAETGVAGPQAASALDALSAQLAALEAHLAPVSRRALTR